MFSTLLLTLSGYFETLLNYSNTTTITYEEINNSFKTSDLEKIKEYIDIGIDLTHYFFDNFSYSSVEVLEYFLLDNKFDLINKDYTFFCHIIDDSRFDFITIFEKHRLDFDFKQFNSYFLQKTISKIYFIDYMTNHENYQRYHKKVLLNFEEREKRKEDLLSITSFLLRKGCNMKTCQGIDMTYRGCPDLVKFIKKEIKKQESYFY